MSSQENETLSTDPNYLLEGSYVGVGPVANSDTAIGKYFFINEGRLLCFGRESADSCRISEIDIGGQIPLSLSACYFSKANCSVNAILQTKESVIHLFSRGFFDEGTAYISQEIPKLSRKQKNIIDGQDEIRGVFRSKENSFLVELMATNMRAVSKIPNYALKHYPRGAQFVAGTSIEKVFFKEDCVGFSNGSVSAVLYFTDKHIKSSGDLYICKPLPGAITAVVDHKSGTHIFDFAVCINGASYYLIEIDRISVRDRFRVRTSPLEERLFLEFKKGNVLQLLLEANCKASERSFKLCPSKGAVEPTKPVINPLKSARK